MITFWLGLRLSSSHSPSNISSSTASAASIYCQRNLPLPTPLLACSIRIYWLDSGGLPKPLCSARS